MTCKIIGIGGYVPGNPVSNEELSKIVTDSDPEWVRSRTGIMQRYFADSSISTSDMACEAAKLALASAKMEPSDLDLIIVCTTSPDNTFPSVATKIQGYLGCGNIPSFDLQAVCAGFIYGMEVANSMIQKYNNILLVGADKMSSLIDMEDRSTAVLFGDGAGAIILQKDDNGIFDSRLNSEGKFWDLLYTDGGAGSKTPGLIKMNGKEVYRHAVEKMTSSMQELLAQSGYSMEDINFVIPHQANERIIDSIATRLELPAEKLVKTIWKYANNSAATIPLALYELSVTNKLKKGDLILMTALGGGLTWGSCIISTS
ncbi:MAG UNVERIFIED_CONTAM: ketoacyl-ACP synthase III [Rickettsiaceae bacterium]|jgi:3-oxoacyl-[acyl-carrier-protein] synthase-3